MKSLVLVLWVFFTSPLWAQENMMEPGTDPYISAFINSGEVQLELSKFRERRPYCVFEGHHTLLIESQFAPGGSSATVLVSGRFNCTVSNVSINALVFETKSSGMGTNIKTKYQVKLLNDLQ